MLDYCNTLWAQGYFYSAVLLYLPVQIGIVFLNNLTLYTALLIGANFQKMQDGRAC
jgi:hypothetical protein